MLVQLDIASTHIAVSAESYWPKAILNVPVLSRLNTLKLFHNSNRLMTLKGRLFDVKEYIKEQLRELQSRPWGVLPFKTDLLSTVYWCPKDLKFFFSRIDPLELGNIRAGTTGFAKTLWPRSRGSKHPGYIYIWQFSRKNLNRSTIQLLPAWWHSNTFKWEQELYSRWGIFPIYFAIISLLFNTLV